MMESHQGSGVLGGCPASDPHLRWRGAGSGGPTGSSKGQGQGTTGSLRSLVLLGLFEAYDAPLLIWCFIPACGFSHCLYLYF